MADLRRANGRENGWRVKYFGVGNEPWGCGGNMAADYYTNEYRHYQTYIRQYRPGEKILKIAAGPGTADWRWTDTLMKSAGKMMDGISLHYYTVPGTWEHKGSALTFTREEYYTTIRKALEIAIADGLIKEQNGNIVTE